MKTFDATADGKTLDPRVIHHLAELKAATMNLSHALGGLKCAIEAADTELSKEQREELEAEIVKAPWHVELAQLIGEPGPPEAEL